MEPDHTGILALLTERGADTIEHPGGSLLSHLRRVEGLLAQWGARPDLRAAGLGHAFYGTDGFATALADVSNRDTVREVMGAQAEQIVYRYAACDRKFTYPALEASSGLYRDRFTGAVDLPEPRERADLVEITVANELDLVLVNPEIAERYGQALMRLFTRCRPHMSPAAWSACERALGAAAA